MTELLDMAALEMKALLEVLLDESLSALRSAEQDQGEGPSLFHEAKQAIASWVS